MPTLAIKIYRRSRTKLQLTLLNPLMTKKPRSKEMGIANRERLILNDGRMSNKAAAIAMNNRIVKTL